ncbi:hypothetical protein V6N13_107386 [Hibiscus sabdariffa]|uniref:Protein BIG GRAIN 1-like B n=1 Tax=Hibiscus sabdariffa TaxID=183260 RepID=A0ABR2SP62_9ROSI
MFRSEKKLVREGRYNKHKNNNPSFSSSLLDQICRSIDDNDGVAAGARHEESLKFCKEKLKNKACLVDKRVENKVSEKKTAVDRVFLSSSSSSSDSSYGGFSSSETESMSMYGSKTNGPCFVPSRPKPVGTSTGVSAARPKKPLFHEQRQFHAVDDHAPNDLRKMKQPISPGARLASFINSLFTTGNNNNTKKTKNTTTTTTLRYDYEVSTTCSSARRPCRSNNSHSAMGQGSRMLPVSASTLRYDDDHVSMTCSSASTGEKSRKGVQKSVRFCPVDQDSRLCGRKCVGEEQGLRMLPVSASTLRYNDSTGEKSHKGVQKSVRFCPVDQDSRPCARKCVYEEQGSRSHPVSVPNAWKMASRKSVDEDDDAASDSSSDLFELDHLLNDRYREELPVYETTHVETNRAIGNGMLL